MQDKPTMRPFEEVAVNFASALVAGEYECARAWLAPDLRREYSAVELQNRLLEMFEPSADESPAGILFDPAVSLEEWPTRQPGDVGWAYVGIMGKAFVEAVSVTISRIGGSEFIRDIEWGRP